MRRTGIVMQVDPAHAIVLTPDGEFCRIPFREGMSVGVEVEWETSAIPADARSRRRRRPPVKTGRWTRWGAVGMAACVAVGALAFRLWMPPVAEAWAMVSVDGDPPLVLQVDKQLRVTSATSPDAKGQRLLAERTLTGKPVVAALDTWLDAAAEAQVLAPGDSIVVTASPITPGVDVEPLRSQLDQSLMSILASDPVLNVVHPQVFTLGMAPALWQAAQTAHLSPGRFAAYLIARSEGYTGTVDGLKGATLAHYLSEPNAKTWMKTLESTNVNELQSWVTQVAGQNASTPPADAAENAPAANVPNITAGGDGNTSALPGNARGNGPGVGSASDGKGQGHNKSDATKNGNGANSFHTTQGNGSHVTVQIGNVTIDVPVAGNTAQNVTGTLANVTNQTVAGINQTAGGVVDTVGSGVNTVGNLVGGTANTLANVVKGVGGVANGLLGGR